MSRLTLPPPGSPVCSREVHEAIKRDDRLWSRLKSIGVAHGLDYRNCSCRSTLVREVSR